MFQHMMRNGARGMAYLDALAATLLIATASLPLFTIALVTLR